MYGYGCGYPVAYYGNNDGFGSSWFWIVLVIFIIFFIFSGNNQCR